MATWPLKTQQPYLPECRYLAAMRTSSGTSSSGNHLPGRHTGSGYPSHMIVCRRGNGATWFHNPDMLLCLSSQLITWGRKACSASYKQSITTHCIYVYMQIYVADICTRRYIYTYAHKYIYMDLEQLLLYLEQLLLYLEQLLLYLDGCMQIYM